MCKLGLTLAVAASNIEYNYGLPAFVVAIAIDSRKIGSIPNLRVENIKAAQTRDGQQDPFDLSSFESMLLPYRAFVIGMRISQLPRQKRTSEEARTTVFHAYAKSLDSLLCSDLLVQGSNIDRCIVKVPSYRKGGELTEVDAIASFPSAFYAFPILFQGRADSEGVLDLARLLARYEYVKFRRSSISFVNRVIVHNNDRVFQVLRLTWNSPPIETYADYFVGYPKLLVRKRGNVEAWTVSPEKEIAFIPFAKYCIGPSAAADEPILPCLQARDKRPYGAYVEDGQLERCPKCGGQNDPLSLLYKGKRRGSNMTDLLEPGLAERIILGTYAIYVIRFVDVIKVGRTLRSRVVARLLEQGASDALIFYPIQTLEIADALEKRLTQYLKERRKSLGDLETRSNIERNTRLAHVLKTLSNVRGSNHEVYHRISKLIESAEDEQIRSLAFMESRIVDVTPNWFAPEKSEQFSPLQDWRFKLVRGRIEGWAGSFLFVASQVVDMDALTGYVVRDLGTELGSS